MSYLQQFMNARFVTGLQDELKIAVTSAKHSFNIMASQENNTISKKQLVAVMEECNYPPTDKEIEEVMNILEENGGLIDNDVDSISEDAFKGERPAVVFVFDKRSRGWGLGGKRGRERVKVTRGCGLETPPLPFPHTLAITNSTKPPHLLPPSQQSWYHG
jgi:hypothetical protein